jgi:hypothetical protein
MSDSPWTIGDSTRDRDDETPDPAIVVNTPSAPADEWTIPPIEKTVAEDNPDYPADVPVVVVVYEHILDESLPEWEREDPLPLTDLNEASVQHYSFPAPRLEPAEPTDKMTSPSTADGMDGRSGRKVVDGSG